MRGGIGTKTGARSTFPITNSGSSSTIRYSPTNGAGSARDVIGRELGDRCAVDLDIYVKSDIRTAKAERDTFILDRIEAGITLYRASRDAALGPCERKGARS